MLRKKTCCNWKRMIGSMFILLLLMAMPPSVFAEVDDEGYVVEDVRSRTDLSLTNEQFHEMLENTHPTDPRMFNDAREAQSTVAIYGTVPLKKGESAYDWGRSLDRISSSVQEDASLEKYQKSGLVNHYGYNIFGFITVYLNADQADQMKQQDIEDIKQIFEKYAEDEDITDLPILFRKWDAVPLPDASFTDKVRPIRGGYKVTVVSEPNTHSWLTIGYPVVQKNNSSKKGFVTAGHAFNNESDPSVINTSSRVYQPTAYFVNRINVTSIVHNYSILDAVYVAINNSSVTPILFVGNDPVLAANSSRSNNNKTQMVIRGSSEASGEVRRYGGKTGNNGGYHIEYKYNYTLWDNITARKIGIMNASNGSVVAAPGDSGGPIYTGINVTVGTKTDYQAFVIGITAGSIKPSRNGYPDPVTIYVPYDQINKHLNVTPYTSQTMVLT